jgi:N-acetylneuraminic acid mutarotase
MSMTRSIKWLLVTLAGAAVALLTGCIVAAFTWVGGSNTPDAAGVYGAQGVPAASNMPGARDGGATWTDGLGNMWMFGGFAGYVNNPAVGDFLNDLWKYSPLTREWTWVGGTSATGVQGVYGTQGVPAATNMPGARSNLISWKDASGNLWLFGGGGSDANGGFISFNDLWKYSPTSGQWTWMGGSSTPGASGVYGTQGVPASTNMPGARLVNNTVWSDAAGNAWMFGGYGFDSTGTFGPLNDLWKYSPATGQWTWVSGSNIVFASGVYGTQGVPAATNVPGARYIPATWRDSAGDLWLFGGYGFDSGGRLGELNDLWKYSLSTGQWTWVSGNTVISTTGVYGTQGVATAGNLPAGRNQGASWTDSAGNLWLFGGEGFNPMTGYFHRLNDLWKFSPSTNLWTWEAGSSAFDAPGVYGTEDVPAASNVPGARAAAMKWKDAVGNVWMFGGFTYDDPTNTRFEMNDLWSVPTQ